MAIWTEAETEVFYSMKKAGKSYSDIASVLSKSFGLRKYTKDSLTNKWLGTNWEKFVQNKTTKDRLVQDLTDVELEKQKVIDRTLANNERIVRREEARTQVIIDNLKSSVYRLLKPKMNDIVYRRPKTQKYTAEHVGVMVSDMHIGAAYSHDDTGQLSQYSLSIFKKRLEKMRTGLLEIVERHSTMYDLPELHIFSLGDVVAGAPGCGKWNDNYINLDVTDQLVEGFQAISCLIASWSTVFPKVSFYGIYGNHGRVAKKGQARTSDNWDRVCYAMLQTALEKYDNIEWHIPKTWWLNPQIQGHSFYLCHGDGIRGTSLAGVEKAESKIAGMLEQKLDYFLMGHFHSSAEIQTNTSRVITNGSFMGGDIYSLQDLNKNSVPEQKIFGIHKKKGITWTYNIYLDED